MNKEEMKRAVLKYIHEEDEVTFYQIEEIFEENGFQYKGEYAIIPNSEYKHVISWYGWTIEAADIILELNRENLIYTNPCDPIVYFLNGYFLDIPIVKKVYQYKKDHWLPAVLKIKEKVGE